MGSMYSELGLVRNPFAWDDGYDRGPFLDHQGLAAPQPDGRRLLQLIGDKGAGKSTHLRHWQNTTGGPYYYVQPVGPAHPPVGPLVYWDEADRISDRHLKQLFKMIAKTGGTVVAGTHRDLSKPASSAGLEVETIEFGPLKVEMLAQWCQSRIDVASDEVGVFSVPSDVLAQICSDSGSSLRDAGDLLHVWVARHARALADSS